MQFKFCPECGEKLITKTIGDEGETSALRGSSRSTRPPSRPLSGKYERKPGWKS